MDVISPDKIAAIEGMIKASFQPKDVWFGASGVDLAVVFAEQGRGFYFIIARKLIDDAKTVDELKITLDHCMLIPILKQHAGFTVYLRTNGAPSIRLPGTLTEPRRLNAGGMVEQIAKIEE